MDKRIKTSLLLLISLLSLPLSAQTFGLKAGLSLSNMQITSTGGSLYTLDFKEKPGFHFGPTLDIPISKILSIEPGVIFTTKGMMYSETDYDYKATAKFNLYYIDVPLNFKASFDLGPVTLFGTLGPYVGVGIKGNLLAEEKDEGFVEKETEEIKWGNAQGALLKRLDIGLSAGAGIELYSILLGISFDHGLNNIQTAESTERTGTMYRNWGLKFSLGYRFGKR